MDFYLNFAAYQLNTRMSGNSSSVTSILDQLSASGHKKVVFCNDPDTGLKAM